MSRSGPTSPAGETGSASALSSDTKDGNSPNIDVVAPEPELGTDNNLTHSALSKSQNGFLSAPLSGPVRPLSPDTLSNLSADEYEQIRPGRRSSLGPALTISRSHSPGPAPHGIRNRLHQSWNRNKGLAYMLLGQVFGTLMNVTTRLLEIEGNKGKGLHPYQILFARMGITFVLASGYMWWKQTLHFPFGMKEVRWLLVLRGLGGFGGVFGMYYSLLYLPLADATVITFLSPSLACWACSILIKEPFTRTEKFAGLVSLVGVILIARPTSLFAGLTGGTDAPPASGTPDVSPSNSTTPDADASNYEDVTPAERLSAVGIALIGVIGSATAYTTIRWIGKRAHPLISVNYFAAGCFIVSVVMQVVLPGVGFLLPADAKEWGYLFFLGTCGFVMVGSRLSISGLVKSEMKCANSRAAIPPRRRSRTRKVLPCNQHDIYADALRFRIRQVDLWSYSWHHVNPRLIAHSWFCDRRGCSNGPEQKAK